MTSTPITRRKAPPTRRRSTRAVGSLYVLRLYVTGATANSKRAIENVKALCDTYLEGRYDLQVVDVYQQPLLLAGEQIVAAPTLVRKLPLPIRKLVGDMSNTARVLVGLDLHAAAVQLAE